MEDERSNGHDNGRPRYKQFSKRPVRPDFTARDAQLKVLQAKVKDYSDLAKAKTNELEALQNENKASNKLESLKRALANSQHSRVQAQVRLGTELCERLSDASTLQTKLSTEVCMLYAHFAGDCGQGVIGGAASVQSTAVPRYSRVQVRVLRPFHCGFRLT